MKNKKQLLGLGLCTALGSVSSIADAAADVKVYGKVIASYGNFAAKEAESSVTTLSTGGSRFGIKATEKIDENTSAIAKMEYQVDPTGQGTILKQRDIYAGMDTAFGEFTVGHRDTPYKKAKVEVFADTFADQNALLSKDVERRGVNTINWKSKDYSGLTVFAQYSDTPQGDGTATDTSKNSHSVSLTYKMKPVTIMLAQDSVSLLDASTTDKEEDLVSQKLVVAGSFGAIKASLTYEMTGIKDSEARTNMALNGSYRAGQWEGIFEHVTRGANSEVDDAKDGGAMTSLAAKRHLTDSFSYYLLYSTLTNEDNASYKPKSLPTSGFTAGTAKEAYTSLGLGIVYKF